MISDFVEKLDSQYQHNLLHISNQIVLHFLEQINMTIRLILGAVVGGGLGLLVNLASTKVTKGGFT